MQSLSFKGKKPVVIFGLIATLAVLLLAFAFMRKRGGLEGFQSGDVVVTYYYLPECPWCQKFKPEWDKFVEAAKKEKIATEEVDASDTKNQKVVSEKGLKGFPAVLVVSSGKDVEYNGERTADKLMEFVKTL